MAETHNSIPINPKDRAKGEYRMVFSALATSMTGVNIFSNGFSSDFQLLIRKQVFSLFSDEWVLPPNLSENAPWISNYEDFMPEVKIVFEEIRSQYKRIETILQDQDLRFYPRLDTLVKSFLDEWREAKTLDKINALIDLNSTPENISE
ncbi:MAG: hypothetical protein WCJ84_05710 [Candidatus Peregrinibacteria bacterium]